ncbi:hypothetical protein MASR2M15_20560 [Anaerolineales bacterium]
MKKPIIALVGIVILIVLVILLINSFSAITAGLTHILQLVFDPNVNVDPSTIVVCSENSTCSVVWPVVFTLILIFVVLTGFAYTTLFERRIIAFLQQRVGPNRIGPGGFLQPLADGIKLIFKEDITPSEVIKPIYYLAPVLKAVPIILLFAVLPFGPKILIPWFDGLWYSVPLYIADLNVSILWVIAISSLATYGIVLAGWSSNNKYSMLGSLRSSAQLISYELSMGLALAVPVIIAGSMSLIDIVEAQKTIFDWFILENPIAAGILFVAIFAETSRAPFDLPEAEQELTQGYTTEYSGMKFALFMMAEYMGMIAMSILFASTYLGGYHLFGVSANPLLGPVYMFIKILLFLFLFIWVRATLPRIRYDRLMSFGWKFLLPLSLVAVAWTAVATVIGTGLPNTPLYAVISGLFFVVVVAAGYLILRSESETVEVEGESIDISKDPIVTGERTGLGWILVQAVGALFAVIFAIVQWHIRLFRGLASMGSPASKAIEVSENKPAETGGD